LIELLVSMGIYGSSLSSEAMVHKLANDTAGFEQAKAQYRELQKKLKSARVTESPEFLRLRQRAGIAQANMMYIGRGWKEADLRDERLAEYAVVDEFIVMLTAVMLIVPVLAGLITAAIRRRQNLTVFVGWKRLAAVVGLSLVPVGVYALYLLVFRVRGFGLIYSAGRTLAEYSIVGCAIILIMRVGGERAMRQRARELGITLPATLPDLRRMLYIGGVLAAAIAAYLVFAPQLNILFGVIAAAAVIVYTMAWLTRAREPAEKEPTSVLRRRMPDWILLLIVAAIALAAVIGVSYLSERAWRRETVVSLAVIVFSIGAGLAALLLLGLIRKYVHAAGWSQQGGMRLRAAVPIPAAIAIALVVVAGGAARIIEKHSIAHLAAKPPQVFTEVQDSNYAVLQRQMN
jgi:hypothetical protein